MDEMDDMPELYEDDLEEHEKNELVKDLQLERIQDEADVEDSDDDLDLDEDEDDVEIEEDEDDDDNE